ncbi:MAG: helix-hairpin-helix domain-containing protein [Cryobacterium sp.]|nr:helix-hairpin-helix domain-containing protein [Cryobacterium sp.]
MPPDPLAARAHRVRVSVGASVMLVLVALGIAVLVSAMSAAGGTRTVIEAPGSEQSTIAEHPDAVTALPDSSAATEIFVHILGEVRRPGLVQLREGDRVIDAVAAAGGYTDAADREFLNLARFVSDGEQLVVFAEGEAPAQAAGAASGGSGIGGAGNGKVNLNLADLTTLQTLPRVGPALAERILQWRELNGRFRSIEDLMSVSGIGEKTFAGLRELVTV